MSRITPTHPYAPKDAVQLGFSAAGTSAIIGTVISAVQNSLVRHKYGALGILTRSGSTIALFSSVGGLYCFTDAASSNLREKEDAWNQLYAGMMSGAAIGVYKRTIPAVFGYAAGVGIVMGIYSWAGGNLGGIYSHMSPREKEIWEQKFFGTEQRRPRSEIMEALKHAPRQTAE